jgi:enoyl-CoA hydratase/carnithine racemase
MTITETDAVTYELRGPVAWLTINRPEARNALSAAVREGLFAGTRRFNADAKVLVLTGAGDKAFCAGGDLKEMAQTALRVPTPDFVLQFGRNISVGKPTIAAVNGAAYAGGFLLAQSCDLCVAADTALFAITEVKVGRGAPWAAPLPWLIPPRVAMQILLTGDPIDAHRARQVGLVNEVVPAADLVGAAQRLAERIGWVRAGDLLVRHQVGTLSFVDRKKYLIKTGGENVYPGPAGRARAVGRGAGRRAAITVRARGFGEFLAARD